MADVEKSASFRADGQINKDERWVGVQTRTFTRWCNSHLSDRVIKINDLACDLQDGYTLCQLLEIISDKRVKHTKTARLKLQMMENLNAALDFIKREGLKLVNIGAEDIYGNNLKIILGLIWTLILRYQINKGIQEGSPKWLLLEWVKNQVRPYGVVEPKDFKTSWIDGTVMSALADSLEPGTNPKPTWKGEPLHDVNQAMQRSLEAYEIPRLMDAEDMVEAPDELAVMTYVSQFRDWADKQAARTAYLRGVPNAQFSFIEGDGLHTGHADVPAHFTIHARNYQDTQLTVGGHHWKTEVTGPAGNVPVAVVDNGNGTYSGTYTPTEAGQYEVSVRLSPKPDINLADLPEGVEFKHVKNSPSHPVIKQSVSAGHSTAAGPGLEHPYSDVPTHFTITARDKHGHQVPEGGAHFDVAISGPSGDSHPAPHDNGDGTYTVNYTPTEHGPHTIAVSQNGTPIQGSPFHVGVKPSVSGGHSTAEGPGLEHPYSDVPTHFTITARDKHGHQVPEGGAHFDVAISGPSGDSHPAPHDNGDGTYTVNYTPTEHGPHTIAVSQNGTPIQGSPFHVGVKPSVSGGHSTAAGPGLEHPYSDVPTHFTITARDKHGHQVPEGGAHFDVAISGPSGDSHPAPHDNGDGTYTVNYTPTEHGPHTIAVSQNGTPIQGSPFHVGVKPSVSGTHSTAEGPGLEHPYSDVPTHFTITARDKHGHQVPEGGAHFDVAISGPSGDSHPAPHDNGDGTYTVNYTPTEKGPHTIAVNQDGAPIQGSPFHVGVKPSVSPAHSTAEGRGVTDDANINTKPTDFVIVARDKHGEPVGEGGHKVDVNIAGPKGPVPAHVKDNGDGTYNVDYLPADFGNHNVNATINDQPIEGFPKNVSIKPCVVTNNCTASGPGVEGGKVDKRGPVRITARNEHGDQVADGGFHFNIDVDGPNGKVPAEEIKDNGDGTYDTAWTPGHSGPHTVNITANGEHIKGSPFHFTVVPQPSAGNSYVEGKGLTEGFDNATAKFKIFLNDKNNAPITDGHPQVDIDGPAPVAPHIENNGDGSYDVEYEPDVPGHYKIDVLNTDDGEGEHVRGSPSTAVIISGADGDHTPMGVFSFTVHAHDKHGEPKTCGGDAFTVAIRHRAEKAGDEADVSSSGVDNGDGTYTATYKLEGTGRFTVDVKLNGRHIRNSPFVHRLK